MCVSCSELERGWQLNAAPWPGVLAALSVLVQAGIPLVVMSLAKLAAPLSHREILELALIAGVVASAGVWLSLMGVLCVRCGAAITLLFAPQYIGFLVVALECLPAWRVTVSGP